MKTTQQNKSTANLPSRGAFFPTSQLAPRSLAVYKLIPLTQGKFAIVDADMFEYLSQWKWHIKKGPNTYYAVRNEGKRPNRKKILMHRQVMNCPTGKEFDHINHKGFDNRRINLRICTRLQNSQNRLCMPNQYKGIYWNKQAKKWHSRIGVNNKRIHLGYYDSEIKAVKAYDAKALELFGKFAHINFPTASPARIISYKERIRKSGSRMLPRVVMLRDNLKNADP